MARQRVWMGNRLPWSTIMGALQLFAWLSSAQYVVDVTDLDIFSMLALCASSAVSRNIGTLTASCSSGDRQLQSCVCSQSEVLSKVEHSISVGVSSGCGSSATDDQWSASKVLEKYCSPDETITFSTPKNIVHQDLTEFDEFKYMPPCATFGINQAILYKARTYCPSAASLYAPCACSKSNVVDIISDSLGSQVQSNCKNKEDLTSATEFYSAYCALNDGTTSFPPPGSPDGDMSYYITALPQYKSLEKCARSVISGAALTMTDWECPSGPQALASCICSKEGMYDVVYSRMTFGLQYDCSYTSSDIPSSAVDVLDFYCSAAKDQVVATVTESVSQSYATAYEGSGSGSDEPQETGTGGDGEHDGGNQEGESGSGGGISKGATIAAAVVGGVAGLLIIAAIFWFVRRRSHKKTTVAATATTEASEQYEKPELSGSAPPNIGSEWDSAQSPSPGYPGPDSQNPQSTPGISELQGTVSSGYSMPPWQSPQELEHPPQELAQSEQSPVTYPRTDARTT